MYPRGLQWRLEMFNADKEKNTSLLFGCIIKLKTETRAVLHLSMLVYSKQIITPVAHCVCEVMPYMLTHLQLLFLPFPFRFGFCASISAPEKKRTKGKLLTKTESN